MEQNKSVAPTEKKGRWSDAELLLINSMFFGDDRLLNIFRMFLFQAELTPAEWTDLKSKSQASPEAFALMKKAIHPDLDPRNAPPFQMVDLWYNVEIKDRDADASYGFILARAKVVAYFDNMFEMLKVQPIEELPTYTDLKPELKFTEFTNIDLVNESREDIFAKIHARVVILNHVDSQLNQLALLSMRKQKTAEEIAESKKKNSNK